jgi:hypothetical protein
MFLDFLLCKTEWYSSTCALTWKVKVTKFSRLLFQLVPKVRRTGGIEFGLLQTPKSVMPLEPETSKIVNGRIFRESGEDYGMNLAVQIAMLPTPNSTDYKGESTRSEGKERTDSDDDLPTRLGKNTGMKLQPAFVEWMQGYPEGWTELID